jgi:hypothetical protein
MQKIIQQIPSINQEVVLYQIIRVNQKVKNRKNKKINHKLRISEISYKKYLRNTIIKMIVQKLINKILLNLFKNVEIV